MRHTHMWVVSQWPTSAWQASRVSRHACWFADRWDRKSRVAHAAVAPRAHCPPFARRGAGTCPVHGAHALVCVLRVATCCVVVCIFYVTIGKVFIIVFFSSLLLPLHWSHSLPEFSADMGSRNLSVQCRLPLTAIGWVFFIGCRPWCWCLIYIFFELWSSRLPNPLFW